MNSDKPTKSMARGRRKSPEPAVPQHIGLVNNDGWLEPFEGAIRGRHDHALWKLDQLTHQGKHTLSDFASGHLYFGLHKLPKGWVFREWAPNATEIYLVGDFNDWKESEKYQLTRLEGTDNWEIKLPEKALKHGDFYKMKVKWNGGEGERIPAWCQRVVQDEQTKIFSAQVWNPSEPYKFSSKKFKPCKSPLLIYECHVGMSQDAEKPQEDFGFAAIGGKDSMRGSFENLHVPPTLVSFAVTKGVKSDAVSPEFKGAGHDVIFIR